MRKFILVVVLLAAAVAVGYWWLQDQFYAPGPSTDIVRIQVEQGESARTVLTQLAKQGVVRQRRAVELYLRITRHNKAPRIQVGVYEIPAGSSPAQILEKFDQGRVVLEQLTLVEGSRFADFRHLLDNHAAITHTLQGKSDADVMAAIGHAGEFPEGRFFPDTYRFAAKTTDVEILGLAYSALLRVLVVAWHQRSTDLPLQTPNEALILASIIGGGAGGPAGRPGGAGAGGARGRGGGRRRAGPAGGD